MPLALVVDDKEENLYFLRALLGGHGYQVQLAHNGVEALDMARSQVPDLVISDILMPVMDGFAFCRRWQADPILRQVPFVFYTATYTEPKDEQLALSLGAARFIIKPKEPQEFITLINEVVDEQGRRRLSVPAAAVPSEEQYLRQYNAVLIRKLEDKLAQLEQKDAFNRAVLDAMAAPIAAVGPSGQIVALNEAWSRSAWAPGVPALLRLRVGENVLTSVETGDDRDEAQSRLRAGVRDVLAGRSPSHAIELAHGAGETAQHYLVRIEQASAAAAGAVIACTDVTELKRAEQASRDASHRKDQFLALLGHELRNPLGAIKTATEVLSRVELRDPRADRVAKIIERQTANLVRMVNDLLDVSRIARGAMIVEREPTDLVQIVRSSVEDVRPDFEARGVALDVSTPATPVWVVGDPTRLTQVVSNLLGNAEKFTERGGKVEVDVAREADRAWGVLRIADDGIGMTSEVLARIFEPFEQAPQSSARARGGLGLGLALVRGLVKLHGGEVHADSAGPGQGSSFVVRLPLSAAPALRGESVETIGLEGARVLVIEDNRDAAETLRTLLEMAGALVAVAYDGATGVSLAREYRPDIILCDIGLPGALDGYAVARVLRREPGFRATQLVALTGYGQAEDVRRAREAGFDVHLTKPVDASDLLTTVARSHAPTLGG